MFGFEARYPGDCEACDEPIDAGDLIMSVPEGGYVHVDCCPKPKPNKFEGTTLKDMGY